MASPLPVAVYDLNLSVDAALVCGASIFLGFSNGDIVEWIEPEKENRVFEEHKELLKIFYNAKSL